VFQLTRSYTITLLHESPTTLRYEVYTAMKIKVALSWVMVSHNDVLWYQRFGEPCACIFMEQRWYCVI